MANPSPWSLSCVSRLTEITVALLSVLPCFLLPAVLLHTQQWNCVCIISFQVIDRWHRLLIACLAWEMEPFVEDFLTTSNCWENTSLSWNEPTNPRCLDQFWLWDRSWTLTFYWSRWSLLVLLSETWGHIKFFFFSAVHAFLDIRAK